MNASELQFGGMQSEENMDEVCRCEFCSQENEERLVGCCRDGECPHTIDILCSNCGVWDAVKEQWICPHCWDAMSKEEQQKVLDQK